MRGALITLRKLESVWGKRRAQKSIFDSDKNNIFRGFRNTFYDFYNQSRDTFFVLWAMKNRRVLSHQRFTISSAQKWLIPRSVCSFAINVDGEALKERSVDFDLRLLRFTFQRQIPRWGSFWWVNRAPSKPQDPTQTQNALKPPRQVKKAKWSNSKFIVSEKKSSSWI